MLNCIIIFFVRIIETMLNTFRTILIVKNNKKSAVIVAFFEISIWLFAIKKIVSDEFNFYTAISYATGFALGTFIAMKITDTFSRDKRTIHIVFDRSNKTIKRYLKNNGFTFNCIDTLDENNLKKQMLILSMSNNDIRKIKEEKGVNWDGVDFIIGSTKKV